ncbi:MAG: ABC transporter substrate-binding protein [Rhodocyclaceae bacterium]|nr:ABC transporter substrate-binding protein [Rhodocyclaceae bacterium]
MSAHLRAARRHGDPLSLARPVTIVWLLAMLLLQACSEPAPMRIGFIGGISGRGADLGISGRNGAQLAVEQWNARGGLNGRPIELQTRDDGGDTEHAKRVFRELSANGCHAVVGPMTSAIALAIAPLADELGLTLVSPTVTTNALSGKDDQFFRVVAPTREFTEQSAIHLGEHLGLSHLAVIYDATNAAYAASWLADFRRRFEADGRAIVAVLTFESGAQERLQPLARKLLSEPIDGVLILANSLDAALLAQQVRHLDADIQLAASEWAATSRLTEMGGRAVEGMAIASFLDEDSQAPGYLAFREAYRKRFGGEPGFGGLTGFDAANVVLNGLARKRPDESLRDYLRREPEVPAAQGAFAFDASGDGQRSTFITTIRDGRFERVRNDNGH